MARLRAGEEGRHSTFDSAAWEAPWLQRFWGLFANRPGMSGSLAAAVCAVFIGGILYSERADVPPASLGMTASADVLAPVAPGAAMPLNQPGELAMLASSTNPIVQPTGSLFDQISRAAQPMPAAFQFNGN